MGREKVWGLKRGANQCATDQIGEQHNSKMNSSKENVITSVFLRSSENSSSHHFRLPEELRSQIGFISSVADVTLSTPFFFSLLEISQL